MAGLPNSKTLVCRQEIAQLLTKAGFLLCTRFELKIKGGAPCFITKAFSKIFNAAYPIKAHKPAIAHFLLPTPHHLMLQLKGVGASHDNAT
jgi:hypothetical protein